MQSENGTWPAPPGFDAGFNTSDIKVMTELLEKQLQVLKLYPHKITIKADTRCRLRKMWHKKAPESLKQTMESLESYHTKKYKDEDRPVSRVKLDFIQWVLGIKVNISFRDYLHSLFPLLGGVGYLDRISRSTQQRPDMLLESKQYTLENQSMKEFIRKLTTRFTVLWPKETIKSLPDPFGGTTKQWKVYECTESGSSKALGVAVSTTALTDIRHSTLMIRQAEAIAYLLAERGTSKFRHNLDLGFLFLTHFCTTWPFYASLHATKVEYDGAPVELRLQFHMRSFVSSKFRSVNSASEGVVCNRLSLDIFGESGSGGFGIVEHRRAFDIRCPVPEPQNDSLKFIFIRVVDNSQYEHEETHENPGGKGYEGETYDKNMPADSISYCRWAGLAIFQRSLIEDCVQWKKEWRVVLQQLDQFILFKVEDLSNKELLEQLMYDDLRLSRSANYFKTLQYLRLFEEWITTTKDEITKLIKTCERELAALGFPDQTTTENWQRIISAHDAQGLLDEIRKRIGEIESLRSGLYNSLSVREATRSTRMNQIMLLFTLATILYLPPTFVATFMALDLFQASDKTQFWNIFGGAIGVTYLAAIIALVAIYRGETADALSSAAKWFSNERVTKTEKDEPESTTFLGKARQRFRNARGSGSVNPA